MLNVLNLVPDQGKDRWTTELHYELLQSPAGCLRPSQKSESFHSVNKKQAIKGHETWESINLLHSTFPNQIKSLL